MGFLDSVIDASSGPKVISEQHNKNQINWVAGMSDPGEMIACGAYQQLRRLAGESDTVYQARITLELAKLPVEHREQIMRAGVKAANQRANLAMSNGKVCFAGYEREPIWHKIGNYVSSAMNGQQALTLSHTDYKVEKIQHYYKKNGIEHTSNAWSIIRSDTEQELGIVGKNYEPWQNSEAVEFVDSVLELFEAKYNVMGACGNGEMFFCLADCPKGTFKINETEVKNYLLITNHHNGLKKVQILPTNVYTVCQNTVRVALDKDKDKGFAIKHTKNAKARIEECREALHIVGKAQDRFKDQAQELAKVKVNKEQVHNYYDNILDTICEVSAIEAKQHPSVLAKMLDVAVAEQEAVAKKIKKQIERRKNILNEMLSAYDNPRYEATKSTAWNAFNGVSDATNHSLILNKFHGDARAKREGRFLSNMQGKNDNLNQLAFQEALKFAN